jgi:hypothetical protein
MACTSLTALPRACGAEGTMGGLLSKAYFLAYQDIDTSAGAGYTLASNGIVSAIATDSGKTFVEVGLLKNTAGVTDTLTKDVTKGLAYFTQNFTLVLSGMSTDNRTFINSVLNQPVVIIMQSRSGNYYAIGLNGLLELSSAEGGTGVAEGDLNGYTLQFSGFDIEPVRLVDSSIIAGLLS